MTRELIEYVAKSLIDHPDEMSITELQENGVTVYQLHLAQKDIGKVIGRRGRVARALRTLLKVAAIQNHQRSVLEID